MFKPKTNPSKLDFLRKYAFASKSSLCIAKSTFTRGLFIALALCSFSQLWSQAESEAELLSKLKQHPKEDSVKVEYYLKLGQATLHRDSLKGRAYVQQGLRLSREVGYPAIYTKTLIQAGNMYLTVQADYKTAAQYLREALELTSTFDLPVHRFNALINLGSLYRRLDDYQKSLEYQLEAFELCKKNGFTKRLALIKNNLGNLYLEIEQYSQAKIMFMSSLEYLSKLPSSGHLITALSNLGIAETELGNYPAAYRVLDSCLMLLKKGDYATRMSVEHRKVKLLEKMDSTQSALSVISKMVNSTDFIDLSAEEQAIYIATYAAILLKGKDYRGAIVQATLGLGLLEQIGGRSTFKINLLGVLGNSYHALAEYQKSSEYFRQSVEVKDSMEIENNRHNLNLALLKHDMESNEEELKRLNDELRFNNNVFKAIIILALPIAVLCLIILIIRYRFNKLKKEEEQTRENNLRLEGMVLERTMALDEAHKVVLSAKERENVSLALLNQQHLEMLRGLRKKVEQWREMNLFTDKNVPLPLLADIKRAEQKVESWGSFMKHFEQLHPTFFEQLKEMCPDFTANDLRHCAYIKLGLSRKEVADILKCTEIAVKMSRARIKKRLGMGKEDSLQGFIRNVGGAGAGRN